MGFALLVLIALVALAIGWLLKGYSPSPDDWRGSDYPRVDSYGSGRASGIAGYNGETTCESGLGGGGDCTPGCS